MSTEIKSERKIARYLRAISERSIDYARHSSPAGEFMISGLCALFREHGTIVVKGECCQVRVPGSPSLISITKHPAGRASRRTVVLRFQGLGTMHLEV